MHGWICHSSFPDLQRCLRTSLPTTWNSIMAVKCPRGNSQLQEFRESDVVKWKEVLKCHSGEGESAVYYWLNGTGGKIILARGWELD